jgi:hypothetical protein
MMMTGIGFDRKAFGETLFHLYFLVFAKSAQYGDSWQKRGEIRGPIANIDRKYDRIMHSIDFTVTDSILRGELRPLRVPEAPEELFWAVGA